ncbi:hypothetical protein ABT126_06075 [Streptomyces sp. NPDC002012]|uniref:hypothetical protein n=1 Tax=unclassified Streptomyces TaxID=2593676 RepID=UPI002E144D1D|nr:hypothetical protein OG609_07620 [Streptomyces sp. NBC_01224]
MALTPRHTPPVDPPRTTRATSSSAAEANEAIRALVDARAGQDWSSVESAAYEVLLIEWAAATRGVAGDIIEAA